MPRINTDDLIAGLLGSQQRLVFAEFGTMLSGFRRDFTLTELTRLIESGSMESALLGFGRTAGVFSNRVSQSTVLAGQRLARQLSTALGREVSFNLADPRLAQLIEQSRFRTVQAITSQARSAANEALGFARARGLNLRRQAMEVRNSIGLTTPQVRAIERYREALVTGNRSALRNVLRDRRFDRTVRRAIESGEPLTGAQMSRMVRRYRERQLRFRAETVARTESLRAVHEGQELAVDQLVEGGELQQEDIQSVWFTRRDERVRGSHRTMHRQKREHGVPFTSGNGVSLRFPGDPSAPASETARCRCRVRKMINARKTRPAEAGFAP